MTELYLHVGLPKTGTTSIQYFMGHNRAVLKKHGICYPKLNYTYPVTNPYRNGRFLSTPFVEDEETEKKTKDRPCAEYESLLDHLAEIAPKYEKIVLSDESIWSYRAKQPFFWQNLKDDLAKRNLDLHFIVYVRRQDQFVLSLYKEKIKRSFTNLTFYEYLDWLKKHKYPLDYAAYIDMLTNILDRTHIHIRIFEKEQFQGEEHNLLSDFLDILGLSLKDGFETLPNENSSVDGTYLTMQYYLNSLSEPPHLSPTLRQSFFDVQTQNPFIQNVGETTLFRKGEQAAFLERFSDSNRRLASQYLDREDGRLFLNTEVKDLPQYQVSTEELLRDTIIYFGRVVQVLEAQNLRLRESLDSKTRKIVRNEIEKMKESSATFQWLRKIYRLEKKIIRK